MSNNELLLKISNKYLIKEIFSYIEYYYCIDLIKCNKNLQQFLNIIFDDSIIQYEYYFKNIPKKDIDYFSKDYFFDIDNSFHLKPKVEKFDKKPFLIKFKGYKINEQSLPLNFREMSLQDKIILFKRLKYYFNYTLNNDQIELIKLINEFRIIKNIGELYYNKNEKLFIYFKEQKLITKNYLFVNPIGEFKKKFLKNNETIIKILSLNYLNSIFILEKEEKEYIFIYSDYKEVSNLRIAYNLKNNKKFHLINNINPELHFSSGYLNKMGCKILNTCLYDEGYQIFSLKDNILIGVLEGPPNSSYEDGYFLFQINFNANFPFGPPKFTFITEILHPNISERGHISIDILRDKWSPTLQNFGVIIYSVQSLLHDPCIDDFLDENAAKLYKEDKASYDETVREFTSIHANYSKFQENIKNMNLNIKTIKKGNKITII